MTRCPHSFRRALLFCAAVLSASNALTSTDPGQQLFAGICQRCHDHPLRTPVDQLAAVLHSGKIDQHRFVLTDEQIRQVVAYLRTLSS